MHRDKEESNLLKYCKPNLEFSKTVVHFNSLVAI